MSKFVEGSYATSEEAQNAINQLISQGYSKGDITLVANESVEDTVAPETDVNVSTDYEVTGDTDAGDDRSMWQKIKDAFTVNTYDDSAYTDPDYRQEDDILYDYREDIANGNIIVLVDDNATRDNMTDTGADLNATAPVVDPMDTTTTTPPTPPVVDEPVPEVDPNLVTKDKSVDSKDMMDEDSEKIALQEERLNVDTNEVKTGEVNVKKKVTEETQTVDVPVEHEEVTIEKRPVTGEEGTSETLGDEEEIRIPIKEEQVEVTKKPVVTDEIIINKEKKQETKHVSDTVRKEDIDVDTEGNVNVNEEDDLDRRP